MTRKDLSVAIKEQVATEMVLTNIQAEMIVKAYEAVVTDVLVNGGEVNLSGFGKFSVADRAAREGRNPQTGESISIPASKAPKFKAGKAFKDAVNV